MTFATLLLHLFGAATPDTGANIACPADQPGCNNSTGLPTVDLTSNVHVITQLAFGVIGAVAVLIIIIAGIRLVTSNGDPEAMGRTRQTIIYASVGLLVVVSAEIIVTFVLTKI